MADKAVALKEEGNKRFQAGDYKEAESLYTQAIQKDPNNPHLFTNRAFTRLKLASYDPCITDCLTSISLSPDNMKAYHHLAAAQLALHHPNEALSSALTAYDLCLASNNAGSAANISALVLQAKKEKWEGRERERLRRRSGMLTELEDGLREIAEREVREVWEGVGREEVRAEEAREEEAEVRGRARRKVEELYRIFAVADPANMQRRQVPDYLIDNISFAIMHDPVITPNGQSYDRATIYEHLRRSETDPLTREPLRREDLRPNLALKQACEEFLEENGWAVDW
ncbi:MAG: hypothetical protein FRX48_01315 [Lasallia pustulata]|uniref:E3 ubiquitin-protein ligase CHIP n=1 Tax=Lasallia pustulata TaxID=136370 RepID=A0A5M8Q0R1_9LECA|nr:MAG: hypothetical protein FRX48_01315 [Lasallia pustulata]